MPRAPYNPNSASNSFSSEEIDAVLAVLKSNLRGGTIEHKLMTKPELHRFIRKMYRMQDRIARRKARLAACRTCDGAGYVMTEQGTKPCSCTKETNRG